MNNRDSCEKLIGVEAGIPWPERAKDLPLITALRREKTVTRCMNLVYAFLTIIVLLLVFIYFWYPVTKPTSTQITIENVEIEKAEMIVPMDNNDVTSGTSEVTFNDTKTKILSPDPSVSLREKEIKDWIKDDSDLKSIIIFEDDVTKVITTPAKETSDASYEDNNLPKKLEFSSDSNESTRNSSPLSDKSFEAKGNETIEKPDAYDDRNSEVSKSGVAETITESDSYLDRLLPFLTILEHSWGQGSSDKEEKESEIIPEKVIEIEKKNNDEETQKSKNSDESTDSELVDSEYESYYDNYDDVLTDDSYEYNENPFKELPPSVEESEEAPITNELDVKVPIISSSTPTIVGLTIDKSDELPSALNDTESLHDISIQQLSESDSIPKTDQDTNEPDEAYTTVEELITQNFDPRSVDDSIDKSSHEWKPLIIVDKDEYDYGNLETFSAEDYSDYSDFNDEMDWGSGMNFEAQHQIHSDFLLPIHIFGKASDEQNKEETTEDGIIRKAETTMQSVIAEEMVTIENPSLSDSKIDSSPQSSIEFISEDNTGKDDTVSTSSQEKHASEDVLSKESDTVESHSIPNDTEDSQQVNEDTVNLEPTSISVEDSVSSNMDWIDSGLLQFYCDLLESEDILEFDQDDEVYIPFKELWMNECSILRRKNFNENLRHLIIKRSLTENASDPPSVSNAGQILTTMQQVIKQDTNYIHDAVSQIHGPMTPVIKSKVNEFFEKMEAISSHIDRLHEQYLKKNKLEDDYVSREFPAEP